MPVTDITSPTLDNGTRATPEFRRNESEASFELVNNIDIAKPKKPGFFSGLLRFLGGLAPLGAFFGPPGWIAGAAAGGLGQLGTASQAKLAAKENQRLANTPQQVMTTPGLVNPGALASDQTLETIASSKDYAMGAEIQKMKM